MSCYQPAHCLGGVIVDGHNRYRILQKHPEIQFTTYEKQFSDRFAAIAWICKNQLGRRNLTPYQFKYLMGQQYGAEKASHGGDRKSDQKKSSGQNDHLIEKEKTRQRIANENHVSESFVRRSEYFAQGVDAAEEVAPGIKQEILSVASSPQRRPLRPSPKPHRRSGPLWSSNSGRQKKPKSKKKSRKPRRSAAETLQAIRDISANMLQSNGESTQTISAQNWKTPWTP